MEIINSDIKKITDNEKMNNVKINFNDIAKDYVVNFYNDTCDNKYIDTFLKDLNGKKILDLGCGIGKEENYISEKGFDIIGIDFAENIIKEAETKYPNCKFEVMDLTNLNFPSNYFDGLLFINTLFHIPKGKLDQTFKGLSNVLKTTGKMLMIFQEGEIESFQEEPLKKGNYVYMQEYPFDYIKNILTSYNFEIYNYEREIVEDKNCPMSRKLILYIKKN